MPNYIKNIVTISCENKNQLDMFVDFVKSEEKPFDFNKICPMPQSLNIQEHKVRNADGYEEWKIRYRANRVLYGHGSWYDWRIEHWGTKWNAMGFVERGNEYEWEFETAWTIPKIIYRTLSRIFPQVKITVNYADEDFGFNCGTITYLKQTATVEYLEPGSNEAVKFAEELWGENAEDEP